MTSVGEDETEANDRRQARHLSPGILPHGGARWIGGPEIAKLKRCNAGEQDNRFVVVSFRLELLSLIEASAQHEAPSGASGPAARLEEFNGKAL